MTFSMVASFLLFTANSNPLTDKFCCFTQNEMLGPNKPRDVNMKPAESSTTNLPDGCRCQPDILLFEKHAHSGISIETTPTKKSQSDAEARGFKGITVKRETVSLDVPSQQIIKQLDGMSLLGRIARIQSAPYASNIFGRIDKGKQPDHPLSYPFHTL